MKKNLFKFYFLAIVLLAGVATSCSDDDNDEVTAISVSESSVSINKFGLTAAGDTAMVSVKSNKYWIAEIEGNLPWITMDTYGGYGQTNVALKVDENTHGSPRTAVVTLRTADGTTTSITVTQDKTETPLYYFHTTIDGETVTQPTPTVEYEGWDAYGISAKSFRLYGDGLFVVNTNPSSGYTDASGKNSISFDEVADDPSQNPTMYIGPIETKARNAFMLSFATMSKQATFDTNEFKLYISKDNMYWFPVPIARSTNPGWEKTDVKFYFKEPHANLYFKLEAGLKNVYQIDDVSMTQNTYGVGHRERFKVFIDDFKPLGFSYFEDDFSWTKIAPTSGGKGLCDVFYDLENANIREEIRLDYGATNTALMNYPGLLDARIASGWAVPPTANRVYMAYGYLKSGTTSATAADGVLISPKLTEIASGSIIQVQVTFDASVYINKTATDPISYVKVTIPEGCPGTIDDMITREITFKVTAYPPLMDNFSFVINGATSETRLHFRSPNKNEGEGPAGNRRLFYDNFKIVKSEID